MVVGLLATVVVPVLLTVEMERFKAEVELIVVLSRLEVVVVLEIVREDNPKRELLDDVPLRKPFVLDGSVTEVSSRRFFASLESVSLSFVILLNGAL